MNEGIQYAKSGDLNIAYASMGAGAIDVVLVPGFVSHLEFSFENPYIRAVSERLARFARLITFDKRGTGMSDPVDGVATLEERMDDIRAVMDATGSERAALLGVSEGGTLAIMFAATYPERTRALVLAGAMARSTWAPDYPWAATREAYLESIQEFMAPTWGTGENVEYFAPSLAGDEAIRRWWGKMERFAASPSMMTKVFETFLATDVRDALPLVQAPTLILHRTGDRVVNVRAGRYLAEHIKGSKYVELPGSDHALWAGDTEAALGLVEEFLTGARSALPEEVDRVLATVMFVDLVGSTERAAAMGDRAWRALLERYYAVAREELARFRGREVKTIGDGVLATFDGPARGIRAARAIEARVKELGLEARAGLHTGECEVMDGDVGGIAVHIGSRVCSAAGANEVLVSSTVKDLVAGSGIEFSEKGPRELKGVPGTWTLFAATG